MPKRNDRRERRVFQTAIETPVILGSMTVPPPGTLVLFSGRGWKSLVIREASWTPWYNLTPQVPSHVGVICQIEPYDLRDQLPHVADDVRASAYLRWPSSCWSNNRYLVEATSLSDLPCLIQGKPFCGVQVQEFEKRVMAYDGRIWVMEPRQPLKAGESFALTEALLKRVGTPYDKPGAITAGTRWLKHYWPFSLVADDRSRFFCVEIVAEALVASGYLGDLACHPGRHSPRSFAELMHSSGLYCDPTEVLKCDVCAR